MREDVRLPMVTVGAGDARREVESAMRHAGLLELRRWRRRTTPGRKIVADNRKARFDYAIGETFEAGIAADRHGGEDPARAARRRSPNPTQRRAAARSGSSTPTSPNTCRPTASTTSRSGRAKLLLHKQQIDKLVGAVQREGMTIVPLKLYFNDRGRAKIEIALAQGKKLHDKRETEKERDWKREKGRLMREKG